MTLKTCRSAVLSCLVAAALSSCASLQAGRVMSAFDEKHQTAAATTAEDAYLLGPDDVIRINVDQHPEWSGEYTIKPNNTIFVTDLGEVTAGGMTKEKLQGNLLSSLSKFITNPNVTIEIVRYASEAIYVLGQVNRPGKISTGGKEVTLRDAVVLAELPSQYAQDGTVFVISPAQTNPRKRVVNLDRILYHGEMEHNITIKPGDIVFVPKNIWGHLSDIVGVFLTPFTSVAGLAVAAN